MSMEINVCMYARGGLRRIGLAAVLALTTLSATTAMAQGMRITRDPVTGALRAPTAEENQALDAARAAQASQTTPTPVPAPIVHSDGAVEQQLTPESMVYSVMVRNADGSLSMQCVTGESTAKKIVQSKDKPAVARKGSQHE